MEEASFAEKSAKVRIMASTDQVKQYLAYWFQLGKKVVMANGDRKLLPETVIEGDRYSDQFEDCWHQILSPNSGDCYVEGTDETIAELLTSEWDIILCCRCVMPIPLRTHGMPPNSCPCVDLPNWPNPELPQPRSPISTKAHLSSIRYRILRTYKPDQVQFPENEPLPEVQDPENIAPDLPIPLTFPRCRMNHG
jgi:hypothetical protein